MSFLNLEDKTFLITGVTNKKSVATFVAKQLIENGANVVLSVQSEEIKTRAQKLFPGYEIHICDVEDESSIQNLASNIKVKLAGMLHSIAFANFADGIKPFHETKKSDFIQAMDISCFSLVMLSNALREQLEDDASVVTISISDTKATSYGYLGPIKAMLDSTVNYLAKSFSKESSVRFNAVCAGPLKTSASAGIPGYIDNYLFAEQMTLRKKALTTSEVANTACFLLSPSSSGVNATGVLVDAGMSCNHFDQELVNAYSKR